MNITTMMGKKTWIRPRSELKKTNYFNFNYHIVASRSTSCSVTCQIVTPPKT